MKPIRAIICDIDGCLSPEDASPLDLGTHAAIAAWNADALRPPLTLCSGRPQPYAEAMGRIVHNHRLAMVAEMGVWLYDPRDNTFHRDPSILPAHLDAIEACRRFLSREFEAKGVVQQPGKVASISLWHAHTPTLMAMKAMLTERIEREGWGLRVSSTVAWINLDLAHVSKGTGIDRLLAHERARGNSLTRESLAGIGDTLGDLAIRERVGWFACPSNAEEALKARADYVASQPHALGVVEILAKLQALGGA